MHPVAASFDAAVLSMRSNVPIEASKQVALRVQY
jgi:hypothetical protein